MSTAAKAFSTEEAEDIARRSTWRLQTDDGLSSPMVVVAPNRLCATARERDEARAEVERLRTGNDGFNCCGGNDAPERGHTKDCPKYAWREDFAAARAHVEALVAAIGPCSGVCSRPGAYAAARKWLEETAP